MSEIPEQVEIPEQGCSIEFRCEHCNKYISRTSREFGMDCEDQCAEKLFKKEHPLLSLATRTLSKIRQYAK